MSAYPGALTEEKLETHWKTVQAQPQSQPCPFLISYAPMFKVCTNPARWNVHNDFKLETKRMGTNLTRITFFASQANLTHITCSSQVNLTRITCSSQALESLHCANRLIVASFTCSHGCTVNTDPTMCSNVPRRRWKIRIGLTSPLKIRKNGSRRVDLCGTPMRQDDPLVIVTFMTTCMR
jgi:hypothetical protein